MLTRGERFDEALVAEQEMVSLYRSLAQHNPAAYSHRLSTELIDLAKRLSNAERNDEALAASREATALLRSLSDHDPQSFSRSLVNALDVNARILEFCGLVEESSRLRHERDMLVMRLGEGR